MTRKQAKKEAAEKTLLKVPNTPEGQRFLEELRKYTTSGTRVWARGRGPRAEHARRVYPNTSGRAFDQSLPVEYATYLAVYVWKPALDAIRNKQEQAAYRSLWNAQSRVRELEAELAELRNSCVACQQAPCNCDTAGLKTVKVLLTVKAEVVS